MWLVLLNYWRYVAAVIAMLLCLATGVYLGRRSVSAQVEEKIVEKEKIVTVEVEKKHEVVDTHTTIVQKPDGTTTTTIDTHTDTKQESSVTTQKEKEKKTDKGTALASWRVGTYLERNVYDLWRQPLTKPAIGVSADYRLVGPLWIDSHYNFGNKSIALGVSVEF